MAQQPRPDGQAVQRAGHHLERAQSALRRPLAERGLQREKAQEVSGGHGLGHRLVKNRTLWRKAVGAVGLELVR